MKWGVKGLERPLASARGRPSVTAHTKGSGLSTGKADARTMLQEKRATTLIMAAQTLCPCVASGCDQSSFVTSVSCVVVTYP